MRVGDRVSGTYMGERFEGTLRSERHHTINWAVHLFFVDFDEPTEVYGRVRDGLLIEASHDGTALRGSAGNWGDPTDHIAVVVPA